jgi:uncharacterized linocin/CFP29 family protein
MPPFFHTTNPLTETEWGTLSNVIRHVGNATITRRIIEASAPLGAGQQTVPNEELYGITEGYRGRVGGGGIALQTRKISSGIVPIIFKDFTMHWRDLEESRLTAQTFPIAKAAAAASCCARAEDRLVFFGNQEMGHSGLMTAEGRETLVGLNWESAGSAFTNFSRITEKLTKKGFNGPFAAVVHPYIFAAMHRVLARSSLLEVTHVRAILNGGIYKSELLPKLTGFVISMGKQNFELMVAVDMSAAFLGARQMNLPFRVFKAVYFRINRGDAICVFHPSEPG